MLLRIDENELIVDLVDCGTTADFLSMLPATIEMHDFYSRIKYSYFSRPLSQDGPKQLEYEVGDIAYWPEGNELLIYYRHDGNPMRSDIIVMGKIRSEVGIIETYRGNVRMEFSPPTEGKR